MLGPRKSLYDQFMDASLVQDVLKYYRANRSARLVTWFGAVLFIFLFFSRGSSKTVSHQSIPKSLSARAAEELCTKWDSKLEHINKVILQTTPVSLDERRLLHESLTLQHGFARDDGTRCTIYKNVFRIEHERPPKVQSEQLFFALTTRADRIAYDGSIASSYLMNSGAHLLLTLPHDDNPSGEFLADAFLSKLGLSSYHITRGSPEVPFEETWASAVIAMYNLSVERSMDIKFFIALDDDTLITSLTNYKHMLDKYSHKERHMVGARSEDIQQFGWGRGLGPYRGASIALTHELVHDLSEIWTECKPLRDEQQFGDHKLDYCVNFLEGTPLRSGNTDHEIGLHQVDLRGFAGAYFQSGQQWLTCHHFSWIEMFPIPRGDQEEIDLIKTATDALDSENVFQNYLLSQSSDETIILTTAYSIVSYRPGLERKHLGLLERQDQEITGKGTWHDLEVGQGPYRPVRLEGKDKWTSYIKSITPRYSTLTFGGQEKIGYTMRFERKELDGSVKATEVEWLI